MAQGMVVVTGNFEEGQVAWALAEALARGQQATLCVGRHPQRVAAAVARLRALTQGGWVEGEVLDLANPARYTHLRRWARQVPLQGVLHAAGGLHHVKPASEVTLEEFHSEVEANLTTTFLIGQWALEAMAEGGGFVAFSRLGSPRAQMVAYNAAKAGLEAVVRTLALEGRPRRLRFNAVAPGLIATRANTEALRPASLQGWTRLEDVVRVALWLLGEQSAGVNGQVVAVGGG